MGELYDKTIGALYGSKDRKQAEYKNSQAQSLVNTSLDTNQRCYKETSAALEGLGKVKLYVMTGPMKVFVETFGKITNIELSGNENIDELPGFKPTTETLVGLEKSVLDVSQIGLSLTAAGVGGGLAAYAATGAVSTLATASTGTAISTLSGAAATKATLAFLGGGSLATGGMGVAGGMLVLGGVVAIPAIFVGAGILRYGAAKSLNEAEANLAKAWTVRSESIVFQATMNTAWKRTNNIRDILHNLCQFFDTGIQFMDALIEAYGTDWSVYSKEQKSTVFATLQLAELIKMIIETPIIGENGNVTALSEKALAAGEVYYSNASRVSR